jgi:hypothetical protein
MSNRSEFVMNPPQRLFDLYKNIKNSELILNKVLSKEGVNDFQTELNNTQPKLENENEMQMHALIQYMYRKNPINFTRFLTKSGLSHLILWTESKCIIKHFGLHGIVYIKWHDNTYTCDLHNYAHKNADEVDLENQSNKITYKTAFQNNMKFQNDRFRGNFNQKDHTGYTRGNFNQKDHNGYTRGNFNQKTQNNYTKNSSNFPVLPLNLFNALCVNDAVCSLDEQNEHNI